MDIAGRRQSGTMVARQILADYYPVVPSKVVALDLSWIQTFHAFS